MNAEHNNYDVIVIGSGPAGQNAAITAANFNARVLMVERERRVGGACVQYGTIPSKTLRETAVTLSSFRRRSGDVYEISHCQDLQIDSLMTRLSQVVEANQATADQYLSFAGVERCHGTAKFLGPQELSIRKNRGGTFRVRGENIFIATGSRPRNPDEIPIDHENILDSDSVLSMNYLPQSLTVFGGGVIASEYASVFACLGVRVTMVDRFPSPMGFLDSDLTRCFHQQFIASGGRFVGECKVLSVEWDGVSRVITTLDTGEIIESDKALCALGRVANTRSLGLEAAGLSLTDRGLIPVNEHYQTQVPSVYAIGDTIGPPALASAAMEQGRQAAAHACNQLHSKSRFATPMGIYTIPEMASVGLNEHQAREEFGDVIVAKVDLAEVARGQIMASSVGLLKLVVDAQCQTILGVQIVGDGATELIHLGQMAMANSTVEELACAIFNFPTLAEAYRLAAQKAIGLRSKAPAACCEDVGVPNGVHA